MKEFAHDNFRFDENGRKLSKQVENTLGKGEIASYEQFLLFPRCFQKVCFPGASKGVIVWEWVKMSSEKCVQFGLDSNFVVYQGINSYPAKLKYLTSIKPDFNYAGRNY